MSISITSFKDKYGNDTLAQRPHTMDAVADYEKSIHVSVMSKKFARASMEFIPEVGSPAHDRHIEAMKLSGRPKSAGGKYLKYHWRDSVCVKNNYSKWGWPARNMVLDGDAFDIIPNMDRCMVCDHSFREA